MKKLCVIIGAGASHDSVGSATQSSSLVNDEWKPPLTEGLFSQKSTFEKVAALYPKADPLIHKFRKLISWGLGPLEAALAKENASSHPQTIIQMKYLTLYLWDLLREVSNNFVSGGPTHFDALVDSILKEEVNVCFLSLNYDFFVEKALGKYEGFKFMTLSEYIPQNRNWLFIKLHGSINWGRRLKKETDAVGYGRWQPELEQLNLESGLKSEIEIIDWFRAAPCEMEKKRFCYPALAIPVDRKYEFVCPEEHIQAARGFLATCPNFLVLGCSMRDENILKLLGDTVQCVRNLKIVNGDASIQDETWDRLQEKHPFNRRFPDPVCNYGFDKFMSGDGIESFLAGLV